MDKIVVFAVLAAVITIESSPLFQVSSGRLRHLNKRDASQNITASSRGNSTGCINATLTNCNSTSGNSNVTANSNASVNTTKRHLNLTDVCSKNTTTRLKCNGTVVLNISKFCERLSKGNISVVCENETDHSNSSSQVLSVSTANISSNATESATGNKTQPSNSSANHTSSNNVSNITEQATNSSAILHPTKESTRGPSTEAATTTETTTSQLPQTTTQAANQATTQQSTQSTSQPTTQTTTQQSTSQPTTQATTQQKTQATTQQQSTSKPTTEETTQQTTLSTSQPTTVETTQQRTQPTSHKPSIQTAQVPMEEILEEEKNVQFFYANVLIPVGVGVCSALLIAFSVVLFKYCRRRKLKTVRYFGKARQQMDHINLLSNSSDEE